MSHDFYHEVKTGVQGRQGHPRFYEMLKQEADLHDLKNHDYAGGGRPLGNFERVSKILELYPGLPLNHPAVIALIYMLKQLDAVFWGLAKGIKHKAEGPGPRLADISNYARLSRILLEEEESANRPQETVPR